MGKLKERAAKFGRWLDSWLFFGIETAEKTHYIKCEERFLRK